MQTQINDSVIQAVGVALGVSVSVILAYVEVRRRSIDTDDSIEETAAKTLSELGQQSEVVYQEMLRIYEVALHASQEARLAQEKAAQAIERELRAQLEIERLKQQYQKTREDKRNEIPKNLPFDVDTHSGNADTGTTTGNTNTQ